MIVALFLVAYFAGTAPLVPRSAAVLETLRAPGDDRVAPVVAKPLDSAPAHPAAAPAQPSGRPRSLDPSQAPPIDLSDLPPPEHSAQ